MTDSNVDTPADDRRGFLTKVGAAVFAAVAYATPSLVGLVAFLNPWRQKAQAGQMIRVASLASLPVGGPPQRFPVLADRTDAWSAYRAEPIGAVFLHRTGENTITAFQVICPHAGCFVTFDPKNNGFYCPCHSAHFDVQGQRTDEKSMSPRDLDTLDVEIRNGSDVWVKFETFQTGTSSKIAKS